MKQNILSQSNIKSQISIFIIISVIMVVGGIYFFYNYYDIEKSKLNFIDSDIDETSIKNYVQNCLDENAKLGIFYLANNGGYIYNYDEIIFSENQQFAYSSRDKDNINPNEDFMKSELTLFLENTMLLCITNYKKENGEYIVLFDKPKIEIDFLEDNVDISMSFPLTLSKEDKFKEISKFSTTIPVRFKYILKIRKELILNQSLYLDFDNFLKYDVEIDLLPYDKDVIIYSIYDEKSNYDEIPFVFNFAIKNAYNSPPELDFIPNFIVGLNEEFTYNLTATDIDDSELIFYSKGSSLKVDSKMGNISYTPKELIDSSYDLCVKDSANNEDCKEISFKVIR